jgi:TP901 family phage tail tape measure protein
VSEFIAEAQVLIRPNTTAFRADLEAQLLAATRGVSVSVPVAVGVQSAATNAVTQSVAQQSAALQTLGAQTRKTTAEKQAFIRAETAAAAASEKLALAQAPVINAISAVSAAQVTATRSSAAAVAAQEAHDLAVRSGNAALIAATSETRALAVTQEQEAITALAAARAQSTHAASLGQVGKAGVASGASLLGLRGAVLTAGAAFLGATVGLQAFFRAVGLSRDLNRSLSVFKVTAGATADEMERVSATAKELGRDITLPGVAAQDAAATMTELARAGLSVEDAIEGARGTLQLATAAQIENAAATELVADALNAFRLSGTQATKVADVLANAANASQGSIEEMGISLGRSAAVAKLVGLSLEETVTLLTALSRAGLSAAEAGTTLKTTLLRLVGDFPKVSREVERLGLNLRDVDGSIRPEFFSDLGEKLRQMTPAARQATLSLLGGSDAVQALGILSRSTEAELNNLLATISQTGTATEVAAAQTQGLGGYVEGTRNEFAALGTTLGDLASGPLSLFVRTAARPPEQ